MAPPATLKISRSDLESFLKSQGDLYSARLGIVLNGLDPGELFRWFLASMLYGARITESVAGRTYGAFIDRGLTTPERIASADFADLLEIMAEGGYVRYDGITSRKVQGASVRLIEDYSGDLNRLHAAAADAGDLEARLQGFWGVGPATCGIFLRELRGLWPKADPALGGFARLAADHLGISDPAAFWKAHTIAGYDIRHFEAALTRLGKSYCRRGRCKSSPLPH
jgi:hypothetical protein